MASVDPYAPCPCGSGEKFKWCCHKVESYADRAQRLLEGGQTEAAVSALNEGLAKAPDNPWLLTRKAVIEIQRDRPKESRALLERVLVKNPAHLGANGLLVRIVLETEGPVAAVSALQKALGGVSSENRPGLALITQLVGVMLVETGHIPAAIEHLSLALELMPGDDEMVEASLQSVLGNPSFSPWLRNIYEINDAPESLSGPARERFDRAVQAAHDGLWADAGWTFGELSAEGVEGADYNLGLCRLWQADDAGAVEALRRHIRRIGETSEAVDLEALCQLVAPLDDDDQADQIQLIWPVRDREKLLQFLQADPACHSAGKVPLDPDDEKSPEVDEVEILDRPRPAGGLPSRIEDVPRVLARALVGPDSVALETFDDGRLDRLIARFTNLAGSAIPPAHPKTKVIGPVPRASIILRSEWWLPEGTSREAISALQRQERARIVKEVWPETPMPYLQGRTPRQAAKAGDSRVALRAALCQLELTHEFFRDDIDFAAIRSSLNLPAEPEIDPETVKVENLHLARLHRAPADRLDDERLVMLFVRSHMAVLPLAMERSSRAIVERASLLEREDVGRVLVYSDLANLALSREDKAEAFDWARKGRESDPNARRDAIRWDLLDVRLRARSETPEQWVPQLAVILETYRDPQTSQILLSGLVDMGLIQVSPNPDNPEQMLMDTRPLQALLTRFGPKITTASGRLGVSAAKGAIWTPESERPSSGGLWTPGSAPPPSDGGGDKPKLFISGR